MAVERFSERAVKQRETAILQSLLTKFARHGCFDTALDDVAADVGIGKGTLYRHFGSREDLFEASLRTGMEEMVARCRQIWATHAANPVEGLRALIGELVALNCVSDPLAPATLARLSCGCRWLRMSESDHGRLPDALAPLVRDWQAAGVCDATADPAWIAGVTVALVNSVTTAAHAGHQRTASLEVAGPLGSAHGVDMVDRIVHVLRRAFAPIAEPAKAILGA